MAELQLFEDTETEIRKIRSVPVSTLVEYNGLVCLVLHVGDFKDRPSEVPLISLAAATLYFVDSEFEVRILRPTEQVTLCNVE